MAYVLRVTNEPAEHETTTPPSGRRKGRASRLARYSCFGPKAIAQIGHLPETLADRCVVMRLQRKLPTEKCTRLIDVDEAVLARLRRQCARFVLDHSQEIARARPAIPRSLNDRAADLSEPLLAVADLAGGDWPELARKAAVGLTASAEENDPTSALLLDILVLFAASGRDRIFSRTLVQGLNNRTDRPWAEPRTGQAITERWLAKQLHSFDIRPRTVRIAGAVAKGYVEEDFREVFQRYVAKSAVEALLAEAKDQKTENGGQRTDPPASDSGATGDGGMQGGEAAAA